MPTPIITLHIHTIEQARALAGLIRAYIDDQQPCDNEGTDWKPDPDLAGVAALYAHLDAGIGEAAKPVAAIGETQMLFIGGSKESFKCDARDETGHKCRANCFRKIGDLRYRCNACGATYTGE